MARRTLLSVLLVASSLVSVGAQRATVSGTVAYRERIALPPSASVEITLEDVSRADASAAVVARATLDAPGQVPIPFDLPYDSGRVEDGHRYAVRARILDGARLLFTTTETTLVLTQGHPSRVSLMLHSTPDGPMASSAGAPAATATAAGKPAATPVRPLVPLPPAVALRLPASFTGTMPCADCAGIKYELNLFPDDSFVLRRTYAGRAALQAQDVLGSWVLSSDRRVVVLNTGRDTEFFSIRDGLTLRRLDADAQPIASTRPHDLRKTTTFEPLDVHATLRGIYVQTPEAARFVDCASGQTWMVSGDGAAAAVRAAFGSAGRKPGEGLLVSAQVHVPSARVGGAEPAVTIETLFQPLPTETCALRFAAAPFDSTTWSLRWLGGAAVAPAATGARNEPSLSFRGDTGAFSGTGGCNRLAGQFQTRGEALTMVAAGTLMACPGADGREAAFKSALSATRSYRIVGRALELYGDRRQLLARFEAK